MANINIFSLRSFCLITGASKGLGQSMAINFASNLPRDSLLFLIARSADGLEKTKSAIEKQSPHVKVVILSTDLSKHDSSSINRMLQDVFTNNFKPESFEQAIIVHNAACLGDITKFFIEQDNEKDLSNYWALNLTSLILMNSVFFKYFKEKSVKQRVVIGISSICSLQPFKTWGLYCAAKAARDMLLRTMAQEEPSIRVLNYAPGPLDTEMQQEVRTNTADEELRNLFMDFKESGKLLSCDESIKKLIGLLEKNSFDSGAHIDYYDI